MVKHPEVWLDLDWLRDRKYPRHGRLVSIGLRLGVAPEPIHPHKQDIDFGMLLKHCKRRLQELGMEKIIVIKEGNNLPG